MRSLLDIKIPDFKFPKFKMNEVDRIDEYTEEAKKKEKKGYKPGDAIPEPIHYGDFQEIFKDVTVRFKDNPLILQKFDHKEPFKQITYGQFREDVIGFGTGLIDYLGEKNSRVAFISETTYDWYVTYMSLLCGAGIAVPLDKELPEQEFVNLVTRSKATTIVYSPKKKELIENTRAQLKNVKYFVEMYSDQELSGQDVGFNSVMNIGKKLYENGNNVLLDTKIDREEFRLLFFTSGTTAMSKGVMACHRNLTENVYSCQRYVYLRPDDRLFSVLPLHHTYESTIGFLYPFTHGASIAVCEGLKYIVPNMKETQPTALLAVPVLVENLYKKINQSIKKSGKEPVVNTMIHVTNALKSVGIDIKRHIFKEIIDNLGGKMRIVVSAAAPIDKKIGKWVQDIGIEFLQGYGLTETVPISALTPEADPRVGSVGKPVVSAQIKIDKPNENGEGEILIKSKTLMLGYYEMEEETKKVIVDGWFHSGDVGYMDKDGYLYITGRSKNVIVTSNGKNIYPEEMELELSKIPYIKECMVYGKGENDDLVVSVKVIPNYEYIQEKYKKEYTDEEVYDLIWEQIKAFNKKQVSYKMIKNLEIKKDDFVKTTTLKIRRQAEIEKGQKEEAEKKAEETKKEDNKTTTKTNTKAKSKTNKK